MNFTISFLLTIAMDVSRHDGDNKEMNSSPMHMRPCFRVLRVDEDLNCLQPKRLPNHNEVLDDNMVSEHIRLGSSPDYKSPLISLTAELNVALAFGGLVSRIAVIDLQKSGKKPEEVRNLDKAYLRNFLTDTDARARSKRSDEVVVLGTIKDAEELQIGIRECSRVLAPCFEDQDSDLFPSTIKSIKTIKALSGSNKRLFQVNVDGKLFVACLPRPNVSLRGDPVLFDDKLVQLCSHQFHTFCAYRALSKHSPRCAFYTFKLSYSSESLLDSGSFQC